ncbi:retrovirus-related pol polyprotein from transposon TNT 1-94, partial [Tanacetum coccineum]
NQRTVTIVGAKETVGSQVVQQTGIQCFNYKEFGHFAKDCRKPKREVPTTDSGTDIEPLEKVQYDAEYNMFSNEIQHSEQPESINNTCVMEKVDSNFIPDSPDIWESNSTRDSCLITLQNKEIELEKYKTYLTRTTEYDTLERKLKETQTLLAQKENDIKEGLKLKAFEISIFKKKHDELVKQSLLTKSSYESLVKEKNQVIKDLKLKKENDTDKLITM